MDCVFALVVLLYCTNEDYSLKYVTIMGQFLDQMENLSM